MAKDFIIHARDETWYTFWTSKLSGASWWESTLVFGKESARTPRRRKGPEAPHSCPQTCPRISPSFRVVSCHKIVTVHRAPAGHSVIIVNH